MWLVATPKKKASEQRCPGGLKQNDGAATPARITRSSAIERRSVEKGQGVVEKHIIIMVS